MLHILTEKAAPRDLVIIISPNGNSKKLSDIARYSERMGMIVFGIINSSSSLLYSEASLALCVDTNDVQVFYELAFMVIDVFLYLLKFPDGTGVDSNFPKQDGTVCFGQHAYI